MAKATYWQKGETVDYKNGTAAKIEAGTIVSLGTRIGIAGTDIAPGEIGSVHVKGVFIVPKGNAALTLGANVYFNATAGTVSTTDTDVPAGWVIEAAAAAATEVKVCIG